MNPAFELLDKEECAQVYLSRRNLLTLLSKLDRKLKGEQTACTIIKQDNEHEEYSQSHDKIIVTAVEDSAYYIRRSAGSVLMVDDPEISR
jgi:hypothetical protein